MTVLLSQNNSFIIGPVAKLLGYLMEGIFWVLDKVGIPNIGLSIIIFTFVIYMCMLPLTIKQQKFSKLNAKMNPEIKAIQNKYKGKQDQDSLQAMNMETKAVYAKYGVSPTGSCLQLLIQMPILFALYRVIYAIPAYVGKVKDAFFPLVDNLIAQAGSSDFIQTFSNAKMYTKSFTSEEFISKVPEFVQNTYIDVLNRASTSEWLSIADKYPSLAGDVTSSLEKLDRYNSFLGLNIGNSPSYYINDLLKNGGSVAIAVIAIMIPVLAAVTQWINTKLIPQAPDEGKADPNDSSAAIQQSMKTMNIMMPIMSLFFCYSLPCGMGLYWIAGAVIRSVQQVVINKQIDKVDIEEVIKKNEGKAKKKMEKMQIQQQKVAQYASMNTKSVTASKPSSKSVLSAAEREEALKKATEYYNKGAKPGSLAAKANMVKQYNERNNK